MSAIVKRLVFWGIFVTAGWYCGDRYGAPETLTKPVDQAVDYTVEKISPIVVEYIAKFRGSNEDDQSVNNAERHAHLNAAIADPWAETRRPPLQVLKQMQVCDMVVSNGPKIDSARNIIDFKPMARINGVAVRVAPLADGCLSSGFGRRGVMQKMHKGLDYHSDMTRTEIVAPADGVIVEAGYRDDYGVQLVLDHGRGVYTRLAHLDTLFSGIEIGRSVKQGSPIGLMGDSGKFTNARHLHYEILVGDYNTSAKSFGLTAVDPFSGRVLAAIETDHSELR